MKRLTHFTMSPQGRLRSLTAVTMAALALGLVACGDDDASDEGASQDTGTETSATVDVPFTGPEAEAPREFPTPEQRDEPCTVGYLQAAGAVPTLQRQEEAAIATLEDLGCDVISKDATFDIQKQVSQLNELLSQDVDGIIGLPLDPRATGPGVERANEQDIPIVVQDTPPDLALDPVPGYTANVNQGQDHASYEVMKAIAEENPDAKFAIVGSAAPVPVLQFIAERLEYWGKEFGLEYLGRVDDQTDTPAGAATAASTLLNRYPDVDAIAAYNDLTAQGSATAVRTSGNEGVLVVGRNGEKGAVDMIAKGQVLASVRNPAEDIGTQMALGVYNAITDQNNPLPEAVATRGQLITEENADSVEPIG